jgi:hypothetical protein
MTNLKSLGLSEELHAYLVAHGPPLDPVAESLVAATRALGGVAVMQVAPEQGAFLTMLVKLASLPLLAEPLQPTAPTNSTAVQIVNRVFISMSLGLQYSEAYANCGPIR